MPFEFSIRHSAYGNNMLFSTLISSERTALHSDFVFKIGMKRSLFRRRRGDPQWSPVLCSAPNNVQRAGAIHKSTVRPSHLYTCDCFMYVVINYAFYLSTTSAFAHGVKLSAFHAITFILVYSVFVVNSIAPP